MKKALNASFSFFLIFVFVAGASVGSTVTANNEWTNYYNEDLYYENGHNITVEDAYVNGNIYIRNCSNVNITNSYIDGNIEAEYNHEYLRIENNIIDGNLIVSQSENLEVLDNEINGNIEAYYNEHTNVKNNTIMGNLISRDNAYPEVTDNTVYGNIEYKYKTEERDLQIEVSGSQAKIESELEKETIENEVKIDFSTGEGIVLNLEYSSEINATEYELKLGVEFLRLVEFIDQNGDGVLNEGESVQKIDLTNLEYSSPHVTQITSDDGKIGYRLESHLVDPTLFFQINASVFPKLAVIGDETVNPTEMKINILIRNFPYQKDDSAVALMIKATSEMEMETESMNGKKEIEIKSETATGYFSWFNEASVDDKTRPVNSTITKTGEGSLITLNYPHGPEIIHDPKLGVNVLAEPEQEFPWLYIIAGVVVIAVAAAAIAIKKM